MNAQPARHLRPVEDVPDDLFVVVDPRTGEQKGLLSEHRQVDRDQIAGLETEVRGWRTRFANLKRDREAEARKDARWPEAKELFDHWRTVCHHSRAAFDAAAFEVARPYLERHGMELCKLACEGAAYDPMTKRSKNGRVIRFDEFDLIFRSEAKFRSFCNRAPVDRQREVMASVKAEQVELPV